MKSYLRKIAKIVNKNFLIQVFLAFALISLSGCGNRKTELNKVITEKNSELEKYRQQAKDLHETIVKKDLSIYDKNIEIDNLKKSLEKTLKERQELTEKKSEENEEEVSIIGANGDVIITDKNGFRWEIPSVAGTQIAKSTVSKMIAEKQQLLEKLEKAIEMSESLKSNISELERNEHVLEAEIKKKESENSGFLEKINSLEKVKDKVTEKESMPFWLGAFLFGLGFIVAKILPHLIQYYKMN